MDKFKKGDILVITTATEKENIGKVGTVIEVTDGDYYTLDCLPNYAYKENCVDYARGADLIREERRRQIEQEGYDAMHDRHHTPEVLAEAATAYALHGDPRLRIDAHMFWPWSDEFWKPKDKLRNLVRAGALIAAAIDRLQKEGEV